MTYVGYVNVLGQERSRHVQELEDMREDLGLALARVKEERIKSTRYAVQRPKQDTPCRMHVERGLTFPIKLILATPSATRELLKFHVLVTRVCLG